MTGFGRGAAESGPLRVEVQARSVNNRFADVRLRLPEELALREPEIRRRVLPAVRRGRVEIDVRLERAPEAAAGIALNRAAVAGALEAARALRDEYGVPGTLDAAAMLSLPGMLDSRVPREMSDDDLQALDRALEAALRALDADRAREGAAIARDLASRVGKMRELTDSVAALAERVPAAAKRRLVERMQALAAPVELDPARVAQEAAFLADRADITEELVRLSGHLDQAGTLLAPEDGEPVGKRFDFLLQEIHRETNTICSKSPDLEITRRALDLKAEVERVREQIQNLE